MNSISGIPFLSLIYEFYDNINYTGLSDDEIKEISYYVTGWSDDHSSLEKIYYIRGLKFKQHTVYYYIVLGNHLLLIDESVKSQFDGKECLTIDQTTKRNSFVKSIQNGYNSVVNSKNDILYNTHYYALSYLIMVCMKNSRHVYDTTYFNNAYINLLTKRDKTNDIYYEIKVLT